jgi:hypothetical protein
MSEPDASRLEAEEAGLRHESIDELPHVTAHTPPDPNAGVVRATPPSGRGLWLVAASAVLTLLALALLAWRIG